MKTFLLILATISGFSMPRALAKVLVIPKNAPEAVRHVADNLCADDDLTPREASTEAAGCLDCMFSPMKKSGGLQGVADAAEELGELTRHAAAGSQEDRVKRELPFLKYFENSRLVQDFPDAPVTVGTLLSQIMAAKAEIAYLNKESAKYGSEVETRTAELEAISQAASDELSAQGAAMISRQIETRMTYLNEEIRFNESDFKQIKAKVAYFASIVEQFEKAEKGQGPAPKYTSKHEAEIRLREYENHHVPQAESGLNKHTQEKDRLQKWATWLTDREGPRPNPHDLNPLAENVKKRLERIRKEIKYLSEKSEKYASRIPKLEEQIRALESIPKLPPKPGLPADFSELESRYEKIAEKYQICGLSVAEGLALAAYTGNQYSWLNKHLRSPSNMNQDAVAFRDVLDSALRKFKPYTGLVNRGALLPPDRFEQHQVGAIVSYPGFTSTSIGKGFDNKRHMFIIKSRNGRYVGFHSMSPDEYEVLFPSNAKFKILDRSTDSKGRIVFTMEEVE